MNPSRPSDCTACTELWREYGYALAMYLNLVRQDTVGIAEVTAAHERCEAARSRIREHEWAAHRGEKVVSGGL